MLEFHLKSFLRELLQWSGGNELLSVVCGKGRKRAMNNSQTLQKLVCYGSGNNDKIAFKMLSLFFEL